MSHSLHFPQKRKIIVRQKTDQRQSYLNWKKGKRTICRISVSPWTISPKAQLPVNTLLRVIFPRTTFPRHCISPTSHFPESRFPESHLPESRFPESHFPWLCFPESHFPELRFPESHFSVYRDSGNRDSRKWDPGKRNSGKWDSMKQNSGKWDSGKRDSGKWDSGKWDSGKCNVGESSSGKRNSEKRVFGEMCFRGNGPRENKIRRIGPRGHGPV
jgi:hypothetical protein